MTLGDTHLEKLRRDLRASHPTLHPFRNRQGLLEIAGAFVVRGADGRELDRFNISIVVPHGFPDDLPIVREVGGRIPWIADRHVELNGKSCVMIPEDRWNSFPPGSSLLDFIDVPVANYFLGQSHFEVHGEWPLGEWKHGWDGIFQYYKKLIGTESAVTVYRFIYVLSRQNSKPHFECPCGSRKKIKRCCQPKIDDLRSKIPWRLARQRLQALKAEVDKQYRGTKLIG